MLYYCCKELEMDYIEAELEARIFPSVDIDPLDFFEDWIIETDSDCETEETEDDDEEDA